LVVLLSLIVNVSVRTQSQPPKTFLSDASTLFAAQQAYRNGGKEFKPAIAVLLKEAHEALTAKAVSVMQKTQLPPSGDRHDYLSIAPYWWPDSTKPGGLPYIRRDG
jgi:hypothetical protein